MSKDDALIQAIRQALAVTPDSTPLHKHLGDLLLEAQDYAGAAASYRRALDLASDDAEIKFALALRFDPLGWLALPEEEIRASNWAAVCLITALVGLIGGMVLLILCGHADGLADGIAGFWVLAGVAMSMLVLVAGVFCVDPGWGQIVLTVYSVLMALCGLGTAVSAAIGGWGVAWTVILGIIYLVGWLIYAQVATWVVFLANKP